MAVVRWNANTYVKNPDTGSIKCKPPPQAGWVEYRDESLRIVSDELLERVRNRTKSISTGDGRLRNGGKAKFLLSGLLRCGCCKHNYIMANANSYARGSRRGGACTNDILVRREHIEATVLGPIHKGLPSPERIAKMVYEMQAIYAEHMKVSAGRIEQSPRQLAELDARIERLRERQKAGDPDMTADECKRPGKAH